MLNSNKTYRWRSHYSTTDFLARRNPRLKRDDGEGGRRGRSFVCLATNGSSYSLACESDATQRNNVPKVTPTQGCGREERERGDSIAKGELTYFQRRAERGLMRFHQPLPTDIGNSGFRVISS